MNTITPKQAELLDYIERFRARLGRRGLTVRDPTQREIARHFGITQPAVSKRLSWMRKKRVVA